MVHGDFVSSCFIFISIGDKLEAIHLSEALTNFTMLKSCLVAIMHFHDFSSLSSSYLFLRYGKARVEAKYR